METKLFVGNLSRATTEEDLSTLFAQAGTVSSVELITERETGNSKRFAFVDMGSKADAEKAIGMFNGSDMNERPIKVKIAQAREERSAGGWYNNPPPPSSRNRKETRKSPPPPAAPRSRKGTSHRKSA